MAETPAVSLPPIPDEAYRWAEVALGLGDGLMPSVCALCVRGHCPTHQGHAAVVAAYPFLARAVLEWAADLYAEEKRHCREESCQICDWVAVMVDHLRRLAREATDTERTQP